MRETRRNLLVGTTVLVAVTLLGGMILVFRELPECIRPGYTVKFTLSDTCGARIGTDVLLAGMRIGRISKIEFTEGDARKGVTLTATIDSDIDIPGDVNAYVRNMGMTGSAVIELRSDGRPPGSLRKDHVTGGPLAWLPRERPITIACQYAGTGLIPSDLADEVRRTMASFKTLADTLNNFLAPPPPAPTTTATGPVAPAQPNLQTTMAKLDVALDAIGSVLGDKENQANLKAALANFKVAAAATVEAMNDLKSMAADAKATMGEVSAATKSASKRFDELISHLIDDAGRMGQVLTSMHRVAVKIDKGEGTAGRLINDPALYENFLGAAKQLKDTLDTLQELLAKWKKEGLKIQLPK